MKTSNYAYAINALNKGDIIATPTEAVYGLSVDPENLNAVEKLLNLKQRDPQKGFIIVASDISQLEPYIQPLKPEILQKLAATWPGPVTWIVPAKPDLSPLIRGEHDTIAVRVTAHPVLAEICEDYEGALISTSANIEGEEPARSIEAVEEIFGHKVAIVVQGALGREQKPTIIKDALSDEVLRPG
jgi:L-threonylcarbamoyladenylate synthase